MINQYLIAPF